MKALICDVCGKTIDREGQYEHYFMWMKDPQGEHWFWPKKIDVCYHCFERMKDEVRKTELAEQVSAYTAMENMEDAADAFFESVMPEEKPRKSRGKKNVEV